MSKVEEQRRRGEEKRRRAITFCDTAMQMVARGEATSLMDAGRKMAEHSEETFTAIYNTIKREARKRRKAVTKTSPTIANDVVVEEKNGGVQSYSEANVFMCYAMTALSQLERINPKDPNRKAAIKRVGQWVIENL